MFFRNVTLLLLALSASLLAEEANLDDFGFKKLYRTKEGSVSWTSAHWANGNARSVEWDGDPDDPLGWTESHSEGSGTFDIDGNGVMQMNWVKGPRFHINSGNGSTTQFFLNTEFTAYFKRDALGGENWGGMVVGLRTGALGHDSPGGDDCDANTYYARFRNDGKWDFEKEWKHPASYYRTTSGVGNQDPLFGGNALPVDKWIGMKFVVFNKDANTVRLELYIDSTSGALPPGNWEPVGAVEDAGLDWRGASGNTVSGCAYSDALAPILEGGGTVLMRSDNDRPYYKFVSVREIDPTAAFDGSTAIRKPAARMWTLKFPLRSFDLLGRPSPKDAPLRIFHR